MQHSLIKKIGLTSLTALLGASTAFAQDATDAGKTVTTTTSGNNQLEITLDSNDGFVGFCNLVTWACFAGIGQAGD